MSNLYESTFEGLENNLKDKNVKNEEISSVIELLKKETAEMTNIERKSVIGNLNSQLEAPESNLITGYGLNVAGFEKAIKESTNVIVKQKQAVIEAEKQRAKEAELEMQKKLEEIEKEETIKENINVIDNVFNDILGEDNPISTDPEFKQEVAQTMYLAQSFDKIYNRKRAEGKTPELARQETMAELGLTQEFIDSEEWALACGLVDQERIKAIAKERGISEDEAIPIYANENKELLSARKSIKGLNLEKYPSFEKLKFKLVEKSAKVYENYTNSKTAKLSSIKNGNDVNINDLIGRVRSNEKAQEKLHNTLRIKEKMLYSENSELNSTRKILIEGITDEYLMSGLPLIQIYKKYEEELDDMHFYDVLDGVMGSLHNNLGGEFTNTDLKNLEKYEKECKVFYSVMEQYENIRNELPKDKINESFEFVKIHRIASFRGKLDKDNKELLGLRENLAKKRGLNFEEYIWEFAKEESNIDTYNVKKDKKTRKKEIKSSSQAKEKIDRIAHIKEQIIKIASEKNITQDEAARQYFKENPEIQEDFSNKERKIFLSDSSNAENVTTNKTVIEDKKEQKGYNLQKIKNLEKAIAQKNAQIEAAYKDGYNPFVLKNLLKNVSKLKDELNEIENENKEIDSYLKPKTPMDIIKEKEKEALSEFAFTKYVETGKNVVEIWKELNEQGNEYDISFEETLGFIASKSAKFISPMALKLFKLHERNTYNDTIQIQAYTEKKELLKEKSSVDPKDWIDDYDRKIGKHKRFIENNRLYNKGIKTALAVRTGIKPKNEKEQKRNISSIRLTKGGFKRGQKTNEQHETVDKNPDVIKVETLDVDKQNLQGRQEGEVAFEEKTNGETQGIIPNVKAIAKKGKVTFASVKNAFSKIVSLKKEKVMENKENEEKNGVVQAEKSDEYEMTQ